MQSVLRCVIVCVILTIAVCFDSDESNESLEDIIMTRNRANSFIYPRNDNEYRWLSRIKSPRERRSEICETYFQCKLYARHHGSQAAYQKYFGNRLGINNQRY